jgi:hypothetical protein
MVEGKRFVPTSAKSSVISLPHSRKPTQSDEPQETGRNTVSKNRGAVVKFGPALEAMNRAGGRAQGGLIVGAQRAA